MASSDHDELLERYADILVRVGAGLQPGQTLFVTGQPEHAQVARAVVAAGWRAGAGDVQVLYADDGVRMLHALHAPEELLDRTPPWILEAFRSMEGHALVYLVGDADPELFAGVDEARAARAEMRELQELVSKQMRARSVAWTVAAVPTPAWARAIFGEADEARLWEEIALAVRLDEPDPVAAWEHHVAALGRRCEALDALALDALRFRGPGTDLTVGLLPASRWRGGCETMASGQRCVVNLPTEEVFTTPDLRRTAGVVRCTLPLNWYGSVAEDLVLRFEGGSVVVVEASRGADFMRTQIGRDAGAARLGEVALVDATSRIGRRGLVFGNSLFDENATCHIALGVAYTDAVEGADALDGEEALVAAGINVSEIHIDVMIGGPEVEVDGVLPNGTVVPLIRDDRFQRDL